MSLTSCVSTSRTPCPQCAAQSKSSGALRKTPSELIDDVDDHDHADGKVDVDHENEGFADDDDDASCQIPRHDRHAYSSRRDKYDVDSTRTACCFLPILLIADDVSQVPDVTANLFL